MKASTLLLGVLAIAQASAFTIPQCSASSLLLKQQQRYSTASSFLTASKDDEIAELEKKLQQLKEEKEEVAVVDDSNDDKPPVNAPNSLDEPMLEMLSESWKEDDVEEGGNIILPIIGAVLAVVFLVGFSQVPVGQQDLTKYSAAKASNQIDLGDLNEARKKSTEGL